MSRFSIGMPGRRCRHPKRPGAKELWMPVLRQTFGRLKDGRSVDSLILRDSQSGFSVELIEYGATIRAIQVPMGPQRSINAVLSYPALADYENDNVYLGATIGRCAGRTAVNGHGALRLSCNEASNHLHGGSMGFSHSLWQTVAIDDSDTPAIRLRHHSPAGEDGYPGELVVDAEFALVDALTLRVVLSARSDCDTPLNMTMHPYFNLEGDSSSAVDDHQLQIDATYMLPLGPAQLPTGDMMAVGGTPFDFRVARPIGAYRYDGHEQLRISSGYDHFFVLDGSGPAAVDLYSPASSLGLRVGTNQKGIQFYSGNHLGDARPAAFRARSALCLEPHGFPNAINEPRFPPVTLRAGEAYRHETVYAFYRR
jgi:aldose 1-epimerase